MAKTKANKETDVLEAPVPATEKNSSTTASLDFDSFFDKNKKLLLVAASAAFVAIAGYAGYTYFAANQDKEAQKEMFIAVNYFEQDSLSLALNGDKVNRGFLDIADEYSLSKAGKLSNFYIGSIYLKQGKFEESIEALKKFNSGDILVQARAYSLIGDAYMELSDFENASAAYEKASSHEPNEFFTPRYLMKWGIALEANKDYSKAIPVYAKITANYKKSQEYNDARKYKARAEELVKE